MKRALVLLLASVVLLSASVAEADPTAILAGDRIVLSSPIPFDTHGGSLDALAGPLLDAVAALLLSRPSVTIEIAAHTDARGSDAYNVVLTQRVADEVLQALVARHVAPSRLSAHGYGESEPIAPNTTQAGRDANQRIELRVLTR
jgi:OOP family OmpA-OmpF porin